MPVINSIANNFKEMAEWRQHIHANPELGFDCHETAKFVVERLKEFGVDDISTGWAKSGVVAVINGKGEGGTIGLRADMDALPMPEKTGLEYASTVEGKMHACGHDGHTTMLLGAARYLAESDEFNGTLHFIFQPAEEGEAGAKAMMDDGLFEKFPCDAVYGLHNMPGIEKGHIGLRHGPTLAASDRWTATFSGTGGHGSMPHTGTDPTMPAAMLLL